MKGIKFVFALALVGSLYSTSVNAQVITGTTGAVVVVAAPPSVAAGAFLSNTQIRAFLEKQNVVLGSSLTLDAAGLGVLGTPGVLSAGTRVNSFLLHANSTSGTNTFTGTISTSSTILGYLYKDASLAATNASLGLVPTTSYNPGGFQGIELAQSDLGNLFAGRHTLGVAFHTGAGVDEIRVITAAPEGSSIAMLALGSLPLVYGIRRRMRKA